MPSSRSTAEKVAESYYDSQDADRFYELLWGGEDIHIGLYESDTTPIRDASHRTVTTMAERIADSVHSQSMVLDLGAGYGGAARHLASRFNCLINCINLSEVQNDRNRRINKRLGMDHLVQVLHGSFEQVPSNTASADIVWSQDAFLHSGQKKRVLQEIDRVLKPGGQVIFTDPMQADGIDPSVLQPVYDRLSLDSLASPDWYCREFTRLGFEQREWCDLTPHLQQHYTAIRASLRQRYVELRDKISCSYMDQMLYGLDHWVSAAEEGYLRWGILHFRKPE